ncbi:MAG: mannose-1-phosphate guanylyltransferase [Syntrophomonadaceae bacterium]|jgi:mannose-1-phosphate guanylyltransferase/mannose-6-phosphate isomerase|nr:mannose-1-phosphate guanylyltransferase [Syntrophomonadaceae bacterium]
MIAVILAGGKGVRLWPESRKKKPKQFCKLLNERSMLDHTMDRLFSAGAGKIMIITTREFEPYVTDLVNERSDSGLIKIFCEPEIKNTAPAIGLILSVCRDEQLSDIIGIFPADHYIGDNISFQQSLGKAVHAANDGHLVTIGITPHRPETGYGYIEKTARELNGISDVFKVQTFLEKPALEIARSYCSDGRHLWNAGIYVGHIQTFCDEFAQYLPSIYEHILQGYNHYLKSYPILPAISFDCGIAEKSQLIAVVPSDFPWCDLGSWNALADLYDADQNGNVNIGANIFSLSSYDCMVKQKDKSIVLFGAENLLVVETDDIIFVTPKRYCQNIPALIDELALKQTELL